VDVVLGMVACALAAAALLAVPLDLRLRAGTGDEPAGLHVEWLFGRVSRELLAGERGPREASSPPWLRDLVAVWDAELQQKIVGLLRGLRRSVRVRELRVWARFGLDDPADTGAAWAAIAPRAGCRARLRGAGAPRRVAHGRARAPDPSPPTAGRLRVLPGDPARGAYAPCAASLRCGPPQGSSRLTILPLMRRPMARDLLVLGDV
jgi:hypothetical protein